MSYDIDQYKYHGNVDEIILRSNTKLKRCGITATDYVENIQLVEAKHYFDILDNINTLRL